MKGRVLLFIIVAGSVIAWGYAIKAQKHRVAFAILIAIVIVAPVLFSANTTLRFL